MATTKATTAHDRKQGGKKLIVASFQEVARIVEDMFLRDECVVYEKMFT